MKKQWITTIFTLTFAVSLVAAAYHEAEARAGGGRSFGSRGSRTYSAPSRTVNPYQSRPQASPTSPQQPFPQAQPQRQGGSFLRGLAGGVLGGLLGGMLFRSLGFAGPGAGGIGIFDILLIGGVLYLIYRFVASRRRETAQTSGYGAQQTWRQAESVEPPPRQYGFGQTAQAAPVDETSFGLAHVRQMDGSFDENRFKETAQDIFFRVQGAWTRRDLSPVADLLTPEMQVTFRQQIDELKAAGTINRLENISVREVNITEAWQEEGRDYLTVRLLASILDYTTDESGKVVSGSDSAPVKFEEYWTFSRPVGPNPWKLSAIQQA
ncbi:import inner membrane translocase subunit Tim44 [Geobacter metallireducens RCH3]|uniref:Transport protein, Tim44-like domain, putative n=1 Tax=Geobacter metallireducens (strain ATCC 53774 / DSM 7210 / GS-15) TaxID=269799 RepID=Q39UB8_GEOMG|nr:Tim44 domain-containing protein [Geobacter metallireducens]ABB32156.1 transport protein, Tim44-like domain, putative [Geobacter metallireducens GS-15]EHP88654.1 import inner membrane translocase subunit Tim44 [Geobacter metallireducens RCH3]